MFRNHKTDIAAGTLLLAVLAGCTPAAEQYAAAVRPATGPLLIMGAARISDGDSLTIDGTRIRIYGIDTPELRQRCGTGAGWPCGEAARTRMQALTADRPVACLPKDTDRYGRIVALCQAGGIDIGRALVREGLAVAYIKYSRDYVTEEAAARDAGIGLWSGPFVRPEEWRATHRN